MTVAKRIVALYGWCHYITNLITIWFFPKASPISSKPLIMRNIIPLQILPIWNARRNLPILLVLHRHRLHWQVHHWHSIDPDSFITRLCLNFGGLIGSTSISTILITLSKVGLVSCIISLIWFCISLPQNVIVFLALLEKLREWDPFATCRPFFACSCFASRWWSQYLIYLIFYFNWLTEIIKFEYILGIKNIFKPISILSLLIVNNLLPVMQKHYIVLFYKEDYVKKMEKFIEFHEI